MEFPFLVLFFIIFHAFVWIGKRQEMLFCVLEGDFALFISFSLCDPDIRRFLQSRLRICLRGSLHLSFNCLLIIFPAVVLLRAESSQSRLWFPHGLMMKRQDFCLFGGHTLLVHLLKILWDQYFHLCSFLWAIFYFFVHL